MTAKRTGSILSRKTKAVFQPAHLEMVNFQEYQGLFTQMPIFGICQHRLEVILSLCITQPLLLILKFNKDGCQLAKNIGWKKIN